MDRSRESTKNFHIFEFLNLGYVPNEAIPKNDENCLKFNHIFVLIYLHVQRERDEFLSQIYFEALSTASQRMKFSGKFSTFC